MGHEPGAHVSYLQVPRPAGRDALITQTHEGLGHLGEKRTIAALSGTYWWYGLTVDVRRVLSGCKLCRRVHASGRVPQRDMQTEPTGDFGLFHKWGLDFISDLPISALGHRHALVAVDYYSKWIEVIPMRDITAESTTRVMIGDIVARYGVPAEVICDNGPGFKGAFAQMCQQRGIRQRFITPDVPRSNGLAERTVQTVKAALRKHAAAQGNALTWDSEGLPAILLGYRCTPQAATKHSPARIVFAVDPVLDAEQYFARRELDYDEPDLQVLADELLGRARLAQELGAEVVHNLRTAHERDAQRFKARRAGLYVPREHHFQPGDFVFVLAQGQKPGGTLGIRARNEVLRVLEVRGSGVLVLENQAGRRIDRHMEHCVPCTLPNLVGHTYAGLLPTPPICLVRCAKAPGMGMSCCCVTTVMPGITPTA
jgi:transposase InsO family protein